MNYAALDEALVYLDKYENSIDATIESGEVFGDTVINEAGGFKAFIQKAIEAIKKFINWITSKVENVVQKVLVKVQNTATDLLYDDAEKRFKKNGKEEEFKKIANTEYTMCFIAKFHTDIRVAEKIEATRSAETRTDELGDYLFNNKLVEVVKDTLYNWTKKNNNFNKECVDNYTYAKNYLKKQKIAFETERKNLEALLKKADNDADAQDAKERVNAVNEKIEMCRTFCILLLDSIKYNLDTFRKMKSALVQDEVDKAEAKKQNKK